METRTVSTTDAALAPLPSTGLCLGCGVRTTLCAFGHCAQCHQESGRQGWREFNLEPAGHLCCGWWGILDGTMWTCLTCGAVRERRHAWLT